MPNHPVRMHLADHRVAELGLRVVDGVASHDRHPGFTQLARAAAHDLFEQPGAELAARKRGDAQREQRTRPDRIDITQRVGGGDGPELEGVVDDRREEIDRRDQGAVGRDAIDRRVIACGPGTLQHVGVNDRGQRPEYLP